MYYLTAATSSLPNSAFLCLRVQQEYKYFLLWAFDRPPDYEDKRFVSVDWTHTQLFELARFWHLFS